MSDDLHKYPDTPPDDWRKIHRSVDRTEEAWPLLKPAVAVFANWQAWAVGAGLYVWLRSDELLVAVTALIGATQ